MLRMERPYKSGGVSAEKVFENCGRSSILMTDDLVSYVRELYIWSSSESSSRIEKIVNNKWRKPENDILLLNTKDIAMNAREVVYENLNNNKLSFGERVRIGGMVVGLFLLFMKGRKERRGILLLLRKRSDIER